MEFIEDLEGQYSDLILKTLRKHNDQHALRKDSDSKYFYAVVGDDVVGALYVNLFWDWVSIDTILYESKEILVKLIIQAQEVFKYKSVGLKIMTQNLLLKNDLISIGFDLMGVMPKSFKSHEEYHLILTQSLIGDDSDVNIITSNQSVLKYDVFVPKEIVDDEEKKISFVALHDGAFVGGVEVTVKLDAMFINRLAVDEKYKKSGVGTSLMILSEQRAREMNLCRMVLGTTEFQAKPFYEKLGFEVIMTRNDEPIGFKSYKMIKNLQQF